MPVEPQATHRHGWTPFERALLRAAVWDFCFALLGLGSWVFASKQFNNFPRSLTFFAPLGLWVISIVWLSRNASGLDPVSSPTEAYAMWGRMASVDTLALVPWTLGLFIGWVGEPHRLWMIVSLFGLAGCALLHVFLLPLRLRRALTRCGLPPSDQAQPPTECVREALGRIARCRLWTVGVGLVAFCLPWVYSDSIPRYEWRVTPQRESLTGLGFLGGDQYYAMTSFAQGALSVLLVLGLISTWGWQRARWPLAPRLSQTRVFVAWILSVLACLPWLLLWLSGLLYLHRCSPVLVGVWLLTAALAGVALLQFGFAPLLLIMALRKRSEAERLQDLATRGGAED